jgi:hypothetical protein
VVEEAGQIAPTDVDDGEPTETEVIPEGDAEPDTPSIDDLLERFKPEEVISHPSVKAEIAKTVQVEVDRARNREAASNRRKFGDPEVVKQFASSILKESGIDELSRSQSDRLNSLVSTFEQQAVTKLAGEIPRVFLGSYKLNQDTLEKYAEQVADSDLDGAFQTLIDGAVAQKTAALEADFDKRLKAGIKAGVKAELEVTGPTGTKLPSTSKGSPTSNASYELTTAEIAAFPYSAWKDLPADVKSTIEANASKADRERGKETVDVGKLQRLVAVTK